LIVTIFTPEKHLLIVSERIKKLFVYETELMRGEKLAQWLAQCRLDSVGFDFNRELPVKDCYKNFGEELHFAWEQVRQFGGGLGPSLQGLRDILRQDIKFEKKKINTSHAALVQIVMMLVMAWAYTAAYVFFEVAELPRIFLFGLFSWQAVGATAYWYFIVKKEEQLFSSSTFFMHALMRLTIIMKAEVSLSKLKTPIYLDSLSSLESILYDKLTHTITLWRERGLCRAEDLKELESEYWFCLEEKMNKYLSFLSKTSFIWSLLFILPTLFATTFFSMTSLLSTGQ
jgi:hypothetical protein